MFADEALEKFFGQARQRNGANFYIDIVDIKTAAETKNLRALLKYESMPHKSNNVPCTSNIRIDDYHFDITIADTEDLVQSNDSIKHKIIFLSGYLEHKFRGKSVETEDIDDHHINLDFVTNLNRGRLTVPLLSAVHFAHSAYKLFDKCNLHCCRAHSAKLYIVLIVQWLQFKEHFFKAFVLENSDKERQLGCLREKKNYLLKTKHVMLFILLYSMFLFNSLVSRITILFALDMFLLFLQAYCLYMTLIHDRVT